MQPGQGRAKHAHPQRSADERLRFQFFGGEARGHKVDDGKGGGGERHHPQREEAPARPDQGQGVEGQRVQAAPADEQKNEGGEEIRTKGWVGGHGLNYTLWR